MLTIVVSRSKCLLVTVIPTLCGHTSYIGSRVFRAKNLQFLAVGSEY